MSLKTGISWTDNILMWTGLTGSDLLRAVRDQGSWAALVHSCSQPSQSGMTQHDFRDDTT